MTYLPPKHVFVCCFLTYLQCRRSQFGEMLSQVQKAQRAYSVSHFAGAVCVLSLLINRVNVSSLSSPVNHGVVSVTFHSSRGHRTQAGSDACLMETELEDKGCRCTCKKLGNEKKAIDRTTGSTQYGFEMHSTERTTCEEVKDAWLPACRTGKSL